MGEKKKLKKTKKEQTKNEEQGIKKQVYQFSWDHIKIGQLEIYIMPAAFDNTDFQLYQKYQAVVHNSFDETEYGYENFLCQNTIQFETEETYKDCQKVFRPFWDLDGMQEEQKIEGIRYKTMGCFHMKYFLRGRLIAINVIDILPETMVSGYFLYEPILKNYNIAVFSALIDIEYVHWLSFSFPEFKYYNLSYYIQGYQKLEYKSNFCSMQINSDHSRSYVPGLIAGSSFLPRSRKISIRS